MGSRLLGFGWGPRFTLGARLGFWFLGSLRGLWFCVMFFFERLVLSLLSLGSCFRRSLTGERDGRPRGMVWGSLVSVTWAVCGELGWLVAFALTHTTMGYLVLPPSSGRAGDVFHFGNVHPGEGG